MDLVGKDCVLDWKVTGHKSWAKIKKKPKPENVEQINLYAYTAQKPKWRLVYIDLLGLAGLSAKYIYRERSYAFFPVPRQLNIIVHDGEMDADLALQTVGKFEAVQKYVAMGEEPPRPYQSEDRFPCSWCLYRKNCWQDA